MPRHGCGGAAAAAADEHVQPMQATIIRELANAKQLSEWNLLWPRVPAGPLSPIVEHPQVAVSSSPTRTPCCVDMSSCTPLFLVPGSRPWMTPRFRDECLSREWLEEHGYLQSMEVCWKESSCSSTPLELKTAEGRNSLVVAN